MSNITKIIHQTYYTDDHPWLKQQKENWKKLNPEHTYKLWLDEDIDSFIKKHFDEFIYDCYSRINNGQLRADFFRYCVLYIEGGVYFDIDTIPIVSVSKFIDDVDECIFAKCPRGADAPGIGNVLMFNAFLASKPNHPIFKQMIDNVCDHIKNNRWSHQSEIHTLSGTNVVRDAILSVLGVDDIPIGYITPTIKVLRVYEGDYNEHQCQFIVLPDDLEPNYNVMDNGPGAPVNGEKLIKMQIHFDKKYEDLNESDLRGVSGGESDSKYQHYGVKVEPLYTLR